MNYSEVLSKDGSPGLYLDGIKTTPIFDAESGERLDVQ